LIDFTTIYITTKVRNKAKSLTAMWKFILCFLPPPLNPYLYNWVDLMAIDLPSLLARDGKPDPMAR
jgi:hypothetical protein